MSRVPDPDRTLESLLTDALEARGRDLRPGRGSLGDVRTRARRRARRRTVTGAGSLAVLSGVGAIAVLARDDTATTFRLLDNDEAAAPDSMAVPQGAADVWRCTGLISGPIAQVTTTVVGEGYATSTIPIDPETTITTMDLALIGSTTSPDFSTITPAVDDTTPIISTTIEPSVVDATTTSSTTPAAAPSTTVEPSAGPYLMTGCVPETSGG